MDQQQPTPEREFIHLKPRCWKEKTSGRLVKVIPWFGPLNDKSEFDMMGLLHELAPEIATEDVMAMFPIYKGTVVQLGWMIENDHNIWIGLAGVDSQNGFEHLGLWDEDLHRNPAQIVAKALGFEDREVLNKLQYLMWESKTDGICAALSQDGQYVYHSKLRDKVLMTTIFRSDLFGMQVVKDVWEVKTPVARVHRYFRDLGLKQGSIGDLGTDVPYEGGV